MKLENQHISVTSSLDFTGDQPDGAEAIPKGVVNLAADERIRERIDDFEAVGVPQVTPDDRFHLRGDHISAKGARERLDRQSWQVAVGIDEPEAHARKLVLRGRSQRPDPHR